MLCVFTVIAPLFCARPIMLSPSTVSTSPGKSVIMSKRISVLSSLNQSRNGAHVNGIVGVDVCDKLGNGRHVKLALLVFDNVKVTRAACVDVRELAKDGIVLDLTLGHCIAKSDPAPALPDQITGVLPLIRKEEKETFGSNTEHTEADTA